MQAALLVCIPSQGNKTFHGDDEDDEHVEEDHDGDGGQ